jgi:UDP-N-acetylglucosamine 2-epimerase
MDTKNVAVIIGTRPEAVKMVPVIRALNKCPLLNVVTISTGQHREMLSQILARFEVKVDFEMDLMEPCQTLYRLCGKAFEAFETVLQQIKPSLVLVQGDTTTAFLGGLCAFYAKIPVGHIEAGLRTGNKYLPFPEEINRRLISVVADLNFSPTDGNRRNLLKEDVNDKTIFVTGNTGIDTLLLAARIDHPFPLPHLELTKKRLIVVTIHRRESFGSTLRDMFAALRDIATAYSDVVMVYPVHANPNVHGPAFEALGDCPNIHLVAPMDYLDFVQMMKKAFLILTDSGGIQEEAPSLGIPVIVLRDETERPEAVQAGTVRLAGTKRSDIVREARIILDDQNERYKMTRAINPYGDGHASQRIVDHICSFLRVAI